MLGVDPFGTDAFCEVDDAGADLPFIAATKAIDGHVYIVEISAKLIGGSITTLRYSTTGYVSPSTDTNGDNDNVYFDGRVDVALQLTRTLPVPPEQSRRVAFNIGNITLINSDGEFDDIVRNYAVDGRTIAVKMGLDGYAYSDFQAIFIGSILQWSATSTKLQISARDNGYKLDRPLQTNLYGGTGGADGTAQVQNTPRPICLGRVFNITPVFIDPSKLVWQIHDGAITQVLAVRDKGVALSFVADYADYATLTAASLTTGQYATCLTLGYVRTGGTPAGQLTLDCIGGAADLTTPVSTIALAILKTFGGLTDTDLDIGRWNSLDDRILADRGIPTHGTNTYAGWFQTNEQINLSDALDSFMAKCFAWWGDDQYGLYTCGVIWPANSSFSVLSLDESDVIEAEVMDPLDGTFPPRWRAQAGYKFNYTVQSPTDLAGSVSATDVQAFGNPYVVEIQEDTSVKTDFLLAQDAPIFITPFWDNTHDNSSGFPFALFKVQTFLVRVRIDKRALAVVIGSTVDVTYPRINSGNQWFARVVVIEIDTSSQAYDLYLWGPM